MGEKILFFSMFFRDVMIRGVIIILFDVIVREVVVIMKDNDIDGFVVVNEDNKVVGIFMVKDFFLLILKMIEKEVRFYF